jgi:hypothetical protein
MGIITAVNYIKNQNPERNRQYRFDMYKKDLITYLQASAVIRMTYCRAGRGQAINAWCLH